MWSTNFFEYETHKYLILKTQNQPKSIITNSTAKFRLIKFSVFIYVCVRHEMFNLSYCPFGNWMVHSAVWKNFYYILHVRSRRTYVCLFSGLYSQKRDFHPYEPYHALDLAIDTEFRWSFVIASISASSHAILWYDELLLLLF